jgi:4-hydroxy-tetrahydrodipicolinate synthase
MTRLHGSLVALVTPFDGDDIDKTALRRLVDWHIEQGTDALVAVGTTGESPTLDAHEHRRVVEIVVEQAAGRIPVVAGAGSNNTREALAFDRHAAECGADAVLHVTGYYNRPSQDGIVAHFEALDAAGGLPILVYNIPGRAVVDIDVATMARLAALDRVIGVKDATCDIARPLRERHRIGDDFAWLCGDDAVAVAYNAHGGSGCISTTANVAPALCARLQRACAGNDYAGALAIQRRLMPLNDALFAEPSPAGVKYAASLLGLCGDACRLPIVPLREETRTVIREAMRFAGVLD